MIKFTELRYFMTDNQEKVISGYIEDFGIPLEDAALTVKSVSVNGELRVVVFINGHTDGLII